MPDHEPAADAQSDDSDAVALRLQVDDLRRALAALRAGGVDAVVLGEPGQEEVYALSTHDLTYRVIVENMGEGSATVSHDRRVLFANRQLAALLGQSPDSLLGHDLTTYVAAEHHSTLASLLDGPVGETRRAELVLHGPEADVPVLAAATGVQLEDDVVHCLLLTDLTMQRRIDEERAREQEEVKKRKERERVAHEVNDTIVQGLVAAEMALDLGNHDRARDLVTVTSRRARAYIGELVEGGRLRPGMAVRSTPMDSARDRTPD